jgi:small conductance mechanosensitive channel
MTEPEPRRRTTWGTGLGLQISGSALRRARFKAGALLTLIVAVILLFEHRFGLAGERPTDHKATVYVLNAPIRILTVIVVVALGWTFARDVGRALGPILLEHMDPAGAGTIGFLIRLVTVAATVIVAAGFAGVDLRALIVGGAFTAVIVGLAAQQTLGNLIAGTVLLTARPFRVGERVRLQGAPGRIEGLVSSLGLLYTTFADGEDRIMIPNSVVLNSALTPLREPDAVQLRARLRSPTKPDDLEILIEATLTTPIRARPSVTLEELDGDELIVQISATPMRSEDAGRLASELLEIVAGETTDTGGGPAEQREDPLPDQPGEADTAPKTR